MNPDGWVRGDGKTASFSYEFPLDEPPYQLKFTGINEDVSNEHTVTVDIVISRLLPGYEGFPTAEQIEAAIKETLEEGS